MTSNTNDIPKLLRAIASGTQAQENKHDVILLAAADEIDQLKEVARRYIQAWIMVMKERDELRAEVEQLKAAITYVRQRSQRACEILNEFDAINPRVQPIGPRKDQKIIREV
jgi:uncharacterized coiled-coil DUF342 family protein